SDLKVHSALLQYLGFVLLLWCPGVLHAQSAAQPCRAPVLKSGFFFPKQETYSHESNLSYACDNGHKPAVQGWWATSTCQNGIWSHKPQCIGMCFINTSAGCCLNDKYLSEIRFTHKMKVDNACSAPSKIPHAVIINQEYKEVFDEESEVQYECEDGYTVEGGSTKSIRCTAGNWTVGPSCSKLTVSGSNKDERQITRSTFSTHVPDNIFTISNCGRYPSVQNGDVVETHGKSLRYQCNSFYRLVGAEGVVCYSDGKWSEVPTCKAAFCALNTEAHPELAPDGVKHIKDGESMQVRCVDRWRFENHVVARCTDGELTMTRCKCHFKFITNVRMLLTETVGSLIFKFVSSNHCQFTNCVHANNLVIIVFGYQ
uniref:Sushi domain-containing protein n=1 Tax=Mastacembelus armatus TaxID=205130 RepID=A0A3Q3KNM3_9TELE